MNQIGAYQAKTHFSEILRRVTQGEEFCVTHRGKVVAVILPPDEVKTKRTQEVFGKLQMLRKKHPLGKVNEITDWKEKGKK
ncbi:hypothetical protein AYO45_02890 [Gammaproteobacteria bacterium SCGC AG-212-F23]|nr:hypothetical protein AYO45_02890 [Gammaproteobacteria bacterium SCGC AG-212-F23]